MPSLIVQIPCLNEAATLPLTVADIPRRIEGVRRVEVLVVDDGSTDDTVRVARELGVDHIVQHPYRRGLAAAFQTGIETSLNLGADIIVNTDGDNQYPQADIPRLIAPLLNNTADIVVGDRQTATVPEFSARKRLLQAWGSWAVRLASGTNVPDATSGFRAYSREAALRLNLFTRYTYTLETIIQAGKKGLRVAYVPIKTNPKLRESRLLKSDWDYVKRSVAVIARIYALYEPLRTFGLLSLPFLAVGAVLLLRFLVLYLLGDVVGVARYLQSVVAGAASLIIGFLIFLFGVLADLIAANRTLLEENLYRLKRMELDRGLHPSDAGAEAPAWKGRDHT
jgi:glycosyltransferase involved in cell wall biosynthesis